LRRTAHVSRQDKLLLPVTAQAPAGTDEDLVVQINLRLRLDEVADLEAELLRISARRQPSRKELRRLARRIYDARRLRDKLLDNSLFGEPAWDMLLALYHLPASGHMLTVSGLCCCAGVPQTTALRWQTVLFNEGFIERGPSETDARVQFVRLTEHGNELVEKYLTRLYYCESAIPAKLNGKQD